jgi:hypothetical protein
LEAAAERDVPLLVATYCYAEPDDRPAVADFEAILQRHRGELLPVFLHCAKDETIRRLGNADRADRGKIISERGLAEFLARFHMAPVPRADCLMLDTGAGPAEATAQQIIAHFKLV